MELAVLGWNDHFARALQELNHDEWQPARVSRAHGRLFYLYAESGELEGELAGRLKHEATSASELPVVGDWVAVLPRPDEAGKATIQAVLPRQCAFSRKTVGEHLTEEQVVAANVDTVLLVMGLDGDFNIRRIERYLTLAWDSGATPVIVLNKADVCAETDARIAEVEAVAWGVPVYALSAIEEEGIEALEAHVEPGKTVSLLGSSGVGKSTLANCLVGSQVQVVGGVREDDSRGRHTTTHRELMLLPSGGVLIDNPGMRELQLWADEDGLKESFEDVEALAEDCRFRDCAHGDEPGCAVRQAIEEGTLDQRRFQSFEKLQRELSYLAARQEQKVRLVQKNQGKKLAKHIRQIMKDK